MAPRINFKHKREVSQTPSRGRRGAREGLREKFHCCMPQTTTWQEAKPLTLAGSSENPAVRLLGFASGLKVFALMDFWSNASEHVDPELPGWVAKTIGSRTKWVGPDGQVFPSKIQALESEGRQPKNPAAYRARPERGKQPDGLHEIIRQNHDITGAEAQKQFSELGDEQKTWASTYSVKEFRDGPFRIARKQLLNEPLNERPTGVGSHSAHTGWGGPQARLAAMNAADLGGRDNAEKQAQAQHQATISRYARPAAPCPDAQDSNLFASLAPRPPKTMATAGVIELVGRHADMWTPEEKQEFEARTGAHVSNVLASTKERGMSGLRKKKESAVNVGYGLDEDDEVDLDRLPRSAATATPAPKPKAAPKRKAAPKPTPAPKQRARSGDEDGDEGDEESSLLSSMPTRRSTSGAQRQRYREFDEDDIEHDEEEEDDNDEGDDGGARKRGPPAQQTSRPIPVPRGRRNSQQEAAMQAVREGAPHFNESAEQAAARAEAALEMAQRSELAPSPKRARRKPPKHAPKHVPRPSSKP